MTRKEALEFLELPESATDIEIKVRIEEKLSYFEELSENAPSDFLRRLHAKSVQKVKSIRDESVEWIAQDNKAQIIMPSDLGEEQVEDDLPLTTPIIISKSKDRKKKPKETEPAGWLIKHMEDQTTKTFPLHIGKNFIGRKVQPGLSPFIVLDDDPYISRVHAVVFIENEPPYNFYVVDSDAANNGHASKNGTYVNGNEERIISKTKLKEGDTVQIGITKLILKSNTKSLAQLIREVEDTGYINTVIFDKDSH